LLPAVLGRFYAEELPDKPSPARAAQWMGASGRYQFGYLRRKVGQDLEDVIASTVAQD